MFARALFAFSGPYRVSRNPMYVSVMLILCGWSVGFWSRPLLVYAFVVGIAFHLRPDVEAGLQARLQGRV